MISIQPKCSRKFNSDWPSYGCDYRYINRKSIKRPKLIFFLTILTYLYKLKATAYTYRDQIMSANHNKAYFNIVSFLMLTFLLSSCGGSKDSDDSLNYSSLNYGSINYARASSLTPYYQAMSFSKNIVTEEDPSTFQGILYQGTDSSLLPDSRSISSTSVPAFIFIAAYEYKNINIIVNPEFGNQKSAEQIATFYANVIGRIPFFLRDGIDDVYVNRGFEPLLGKDNTLVIYSQLADSLHTDGILEEILIRQSVHASLDAEFNESSEWHSAKIDDGKTISQLAADRSNEDVAESVLAYISTRYRANRIPASAEQTIINTIPNRIDYFDFRGFVMHPIAIDEQGEWINNDDQKNGFYNQWEKKVSL
jgi:hypothetical protein